ncbi:MAG: nucleoside hydrolase [Saonia sp.]
MKLFVSMVKVAIVIFSPLLLQGQKQEMPSRNLIIDLDTGNEVDDLYALSRILLEKTVDVLAINATHWQTSHWAIPNTMENSHRLNQQLLAILNMEKKTNRGAIARMYDWGDRAQHSASAYEIIQRAQQLKDGEKLTVIALGALTNVASALFIDDAIEEKIKLYWLGATYDFEKGVFGQTDFNSIMDIYALQSLLHSKVEMHILPLNVAKALKVGYQDLSTTFQNNPLGIYLLNRWDDHLDPLRKERILWDVALIEAFLHPEWSESVTIKMSKDNGGRNIRFYQQINAKMMLQDFKSEIVRFKPTRP